MGALIMFGLVIVIANVGGLYFYFQDKKTKQKLCNNMMNVIIEKQKDGTYLAYNKDGNGVSLIGEGNTVSEAKDDFFNSMQEVIDTCKETGIAIPSFLEEKPNFITN